MTTQERQARNSAGERLRTFALSAEARDRAEALATRYWEYAAYAALVLTAIVLRWYDLGARAMHHDESLHGAYSYDFTEALRQAFTFGTANRATWEHIPFMHGPFQFIGNGFVMWIFNDGDYQARMLAAVMGTAMVFMPFLLRKQLGTFGALTAAALIAFSPTLTYYSRFTREDIYAAFWVLGLAIFMWRYLATRADHFLYLAAGFMAFSFLTKELSLITTASFLVFLDYVLAGSLAEKVRAKSPHMTGFQYAQVTVALIPVAWLAVFAWPFIADLRQRYDLDEIPVEGNLLLVLATLAAPAFAAFLQVPFGDSWMLRAYEASDFHVHPDEAGFAYAVIFLLLGFSVSIGLLWEPRTWLIAAASFWVPYIALSTTFLTNIEGFYSVLWGSWDYWLSQQDVARGNQPIYYYFVTIPVYEFVALALSVAAMLYYGIRAQTYRAAIVGGVLLAIIVLLAGPVGPHLFKASLFHVYAPFLLLIAVTLALPMDHLNRFLIFWVLVSYFSLTVAAEKMPWLNVHIAVALCVLAGKFVGDVVQRSDLRADLPKLERLAPFLYAGVASALCILVFAVIGPFQAASIGGWTLAVVAAVSVWWALTGYSRRTAVQVALVGAVAAFSIFSLRAALLASWGHPDNPHVGLPGDVAHRDYGEVPIEMLVYTQSSGDIPVLRDRIAEYARKSGQGYNVQIVVDGSDGFSWPWAWYLRDYKAVGYPQIKPDYQPPPNAIILAHQQNATSVQLNGDYDPGVPYHHRRWFPEEYRTDDGVYTTYDFFGDVFSAGRVDEWLDFWVRKTLPANAPGSVDGVAFFPKGAGVQTVPAGPTVRTEGTHLVIGGQGFANGQLSGAAGVAFDSAGNIYVADTNNNRVEKYDADGNFLAVAGGFNTTDVRFTQPWAVAVSDNGAVFVADTWAHRIVKLDSDLKHVKAWGDPCTNIEAGCDPFQLYGPRDIAVAPGGHVLVSDTGNARVIEYNADGDFVREFGAKGTSGAALEFNEPVGLLVAENGDIYVGDFWNKRIVVLDSTLNEKRVIAVDGWGSQGVTDRGYLALLPDGRLLATDPEHGKILVFSAEGQPLPSYDLPQDGNQPFARPIGIALDAANVLVSDSAASVLRRIPLTEIAP